MSVRIRGIYATALTERLSGEFEVVGASPPIRERFDREFGPGPADAAVGATDDRQGVELAGDPETVGDLRAALGAVARDTLAWPAAVPRGAVYDAAVERTGSGGAVLDLGDAEGYLPYSDADRRVEEGDRVRVRVAEAAAPWRDDRPVADTELRVGGPLLALVRGTEATVARDPTDGELARLAETLPAAGEVPDRWGIRFGRAATDEAVGVGALGDALAAAAADATAVEAALDGEGEPPRQLAAPAATAFVWFGRESRFALDQDRAGVTATMAGHHRTKAAASAASDAVDFAEALGADPDAFPVAAVLNQFGPAPGDRVRIDHGKPDGRRLVLGRAEVADRDPGEGELELRREMTGGGEYDALGVPREAGDVAVTKVREGRWWYPTVYRGDDGVKGTYVNVCTPVELFPEAVRYVDLHVDVVKHAGGTVDVVDRDELEAAVAAGHVGEPLAEHAVEVADGVAEGLR
jgi:hypothetical protein